MGKIIAIAGASGTGKSTAIMPNPKLGIKGLNPEETVLINIAGKPLPMRRAEDYYNPDLKISRGGNYIHTSNPEEVIDIINYVSEHRTDIKNIVIDDK